MLKLIVTVLAVAIAGAANAAGWRSLRVDGSSEANFTKSVAEFEQKLSPARHQVFVLALQDIWNEGAKTAEANQREYTADEYFRQLDGLRYREVVRFTDPTGDTAEARYRDASRYYAQTFPRPALSTPNFSPRPGQGQANVDRPTVGADGFTVVERWQQRQ